MAEPKSKWSKMRSRRSRSNWKLAAPTLTECPQCHQLMKAHQACKSCGYYNGRQVINVDEKG